MDYPSPKVSGGSQPALGRNRKFARVLEEMDIDVSAAASSSTAAEPPAVQEEESERPRAPGTKFPRSLGELDTELRLKKAKQEMEIREQRRIDTENANAAAREAAARAKAVAVALFASAEDASRDGASSSVVVDLAFAAMMQLPPVLMLLRQPTNPFQYLFPRFLFIQTRIEAIRFSPLSPPCAIFHAVVSSLNHWPEFTGTLVFPHNRRTFNLTFKRLGDVTVVSKLLRFYPMQDTKPRTFTFQTRSALRVCDKTGVIEGAYGPALAVPAAKCACCHEGFTVEDATEAARYWESLPMGSQDISGSAKKFADAVRRFPTCLLMSTVCYHVFHAQCLQARPRTCPCCGIPLTTVWLASFGRDSWPYAHVDYETVGDIAEPDCTPVMGGMAYMRTYA